MTANASQNEPCGTTLPYLGDVCVLGTGKTGLAVISYCQKLLGAGSDRITSLSVYEDDSKPLAGNYDLGIVSPGIPPHNALHTAALAACREVISEPEFAWREQPERWIAVTGTNGKSTTTALLAHLLGPQAMAVGNIGTPCIEAIQTRESGAWLVAELSSYQLHSTRRFAPEAAILLNITPDHLSWHGSHEAYTAAKLKVFANMPATAPRIIDATLPATRAIVREQRAAGNRVVPLGTTDGITGDMTARCGAPEAAFVNPTTGMLTVALATETVELIPAAELHIKGEHNQLNALAAAAAALAVGTPPAAVRAGLASFEPLEHRIEPAGEVAGVRFFNDSKATNPDATLKALTSFDAAPIIALFGGRDKGTTLDELAAVASTTCKLAICYGEAGERFYNAFTDKGGPRALRAPHFSAAFTTAVANAAPGDVVLLSPACASFDEFSCFEERGERFKELVKEYASKKDSGVFRGDGTR
jgi:UDP-N-acetylmuramoylalanine--D-glutamate ligase